MIEEAAAQGTPLEGMFVEPVLLALLCRELSPVTPEEYYGIPFWPVVRH